MGLSSQTKPVFRMSVRAVFSFASETRSLHAFARQVPAPNGRHTEKAKTLCGRWVCAGSMYGNDVDIDVSIEGFKKCKRCEQILEKAS